MTSHPEQRENIQKEKSSKPAKLKQSTYQTRQQKPSKLDG
jgi:hypothetical protein